MTTEQSHETDIRVAGEIRKRNSGKRAGLEPTTWTARLLPELNTLANLQIKWKMIYFNYFNVWS
jgi:predicted GNAT superfamily acetyltransferase